MLFGGKVVLFPLKRYAQRQKACWTKTAVYKPQVIQYALRLASINQAVIEWPHFFVQGFDLAKSTKNQYCATVIVIAGSPSVFSATPHRGLFVPATRTQKGFLWIFVVGWCFEFWRVTAIRLSVMGLRRWGYRFWCNLMLPWTHAAAYCWWNRCTFINQLSYRLHHLRQAVVFLRCSSLQSR